MKINLNPEMNSNIADIMRVSKQPAQMYGAALIDAYRASGLGPDEIPHWIPVSERLPKLDELVLLFLDNSKEKKITTGKRYAVDGIITDDGRYNGKWCVGFDRLDPNFLVEKYVTHWMPLPAAPKEEK